MDTAKWYRPIGVASTPSSIGFYGYEDEEEQYLNDRIALREYAERKGLIAA